MASVIERAADRLHWEITNEGRSIDMAEAKAIVRIVLAAIRDGFDQSGLVQGVRQMEEVEGSESARQASRIYDGVIDWFDAALSEGW
jgi:hypothetical protein